MPILTGCCAKTLTEASAHRNAKTTLPNAYTIVSSLRLPGLVRLLRVRGPRPQARYRGALPRYKLRNRDSA